MARVRNSRKECKRRDERLVEKKMFVDNEKGNDVREAPGAQGQRGRSRTALNVITERNKTPGFGRIWELLAGQELLRPQGRMAGQIWGLKELLGGTKMAKNPFDAHGPL